MHPKGAYMHPKVAAYMHPKVAAHMHSIIPQTELAMRGSNGVGLEGAMKSSVERSRIRSLIFAVIYGTW